MRACKFQFNGNKFLAMFLAMHVTAHVVRQLLVTKKVSASLIPVHDVYMTLWKEYLPNLAFVLNGRILHLFFCMMMIIHRDT